ncbi:hypothetical protein CLU81_0502 [Flavobacterium sp. 9]|nr:hypothetical protein CLU81_0502 [Flavobacterium sp. 9]
MFNYFWKNFISKLFHSWELVLKKFYLIRLLATMDEKKKNIKLTNQILKKKHFYRHNGYIFIPAIIIFVVIGVLSPIERCLQGTINVGWIISFS